ncbi:hypothetical protein H5T51_06155, partial [Candidatus Bathyarchaeota archaeon]|nr:hypothetical protein [Candidatus Bathyarchaeota archaeon]
MFETWGLLGNTLILLISILVMDRASDWTIVNSVKVADITGFGKTTVGFLLIALSTSLPELFVSIFAALSGEGIGLAVGNIIGSNIANICLILGVCLFVAALKVSETLDLAPLLAKEETGSLYFGLFVTSIIPLALCYIGYASRFIGVALLGIFVYYVYQLSKVKKLKDESSLG